MPIRAIQIKNHLRILSTMKSFQGCKNPPTNKYKSNEARKKMMKSTILRESVDIEINVQRVRPKEVYAERQRSIITTAIHAMKIGPTHLSGFYSQEE